MINNNRRGARGEAVIEMDDREVTVLYTNRALATAERGCGKSILNIVDGYESYGSGVTEMAHLLRAGMDASRQDQRLGGRSVSLQDAFDVMDEAGFTRVATAIMVAVADVLSYGAEDEAEDPKNL